MEIIPHRQVVIDSELIERVRANYEVSFTYESLHKAAADLAVLWNWWISN